MTTRVEHIGKRISTNDYRSFLQSKAVRVIERGLADVPPLNPVMFPFQRDCVAFLLRAGSGGLFLDTGLGKTLCELEWSKHAAAATNGRALILTPLAVAWQIQREAERFGYNARVIRDGSNIRDGISICNYDRFDKIEPEAFGAVALDESSILKNFTGKTAAALIAAFSGHRFKIAATATPAPNDHLEIGQHSDFLGVMPQTEMLMRWFTHDSGETSVWRLKSHGETDFWDWMASWSRMAERPSDLGDDDTGFILPPLNIKRHRAIGDRPVIGEGLFAEAAMNAATMHDIKRQTAKARADKAGELAMSDREPWVLWVDTDYEADALKAACPAAVEIRGPMDTDRKEEILRGFADGDIRVLITKPSITGHGLNWQHAARMAFVGRSFSYESWYQAVRRMWRFGQKRPVDIHLIVAEGEDAIGRVIDRKAEDHSRMKAAMTAAMGRARAADVLLKRPYEPTHKGRPPAWLSV